MPNFNVRIDEQLKVDSFGVIESFGLTPSQFIRLVLKQVADTGSLPLSFEKRERVLTPQAQRKLQESLAEFERGEYTTYSSVEELNQAMLEMVR